MSDKNAEGRDTGYAFASPQIVEATKPLKNGLTLLDVHRSGVMVAENPKSPWHHATFLAYGTTVQDADGKVVQEVALWETTDADGDSTWSILWRPAEGPGKLEFVQGTGKWEGIAGGGMALGVVRARADDHAMPRWEMCWRTDGARSGDADGAAQAAYTDYDTGYSFHGPHVTRSKKELANGIGLVVSTQSGVLTSMNPEANSPRHHATCFDRGTTVQVDGKVVGDVMLLEDQDPDGDLVWLIHVWWYGKGPGWYRFLGGTGKWAGITGTGTTLGMLRRRADDHYMLKSEIRWRIER